MSIITLTTDLGYRDHYTASLKGTLYSLYGGATVVDISHGISPYNIMEAAFILKSSFHKFPPGSIHLIAVDAEGTARTETIVMFHQGHYFVGPDNGVMSLIKGEEEVECILVDTQQLPPLGIARAFLAQKRLAPIAVQLALQTPLSELGEDHLMRESLWGEPSYVGGSLRGIVLHIDHFGNAITNILRSTFMETKGDRSFQIFIRNLRLQRIVTGYGDVSKGDSLAIFSDNDHLEIAIREGSAAQLLGLKVQDMLTIEFYG